MIDGGVDEAAALNRHLVCASRAGAKPERRQPKLPKPTAAFDRDDFGHTSHKQSADCRSFAKCFDRSAGKQTKATRNTYLPTILATAQTSISRQASKAF